MGTWKKAWRLYMIWCHVVNAASSNSSLPPSMVDGPSRDQNFSEETTGVENSYLFSPDGPALDSSDIAQSLSSIDLNGWRPLIDAHYGPSLDGIPKSTRYDREETTKNLSTPGTQGRMSIRQLEVPFLLAFIGSIGGVLGVISFALDMGKKIGTAIVDAINRDPHEGRDPSWVVAIQVGLDTAGLKGAGGNFPQVCLYDAGAQLLGYTDTAIKIQHAKFYYKGKGATHHNTYESPRPEGMPDLQSGGIRAVGVWPLKGRPDLGSQQAPYIVLIKRHYDAICVSGVFVSWPDGSKWAFDGTWARASDQAWFYSHVFDERDSSTPGECFWLDHRGTLNHTWDREEEYIHKDFNRIGLPGSGVVKDHFPSWLWASDVQQEEGLPAGTDLTEEMKKNRVDEGWVPQGVKVFLPAFKASNYQSLSNLTLEDITKNQGKLNWIDSSFIPKLGENNLVLPYLHPNDEWRDPKARLLAGSPKNIGQSLQAPPECLTDWYYDASDNLVNPADGERCQYKGKALPWHECRKKHHNRDSEDVKKRPKSIKQHFSRSLVIEKISRNNGTSTADLCGDKNSVGPSYANHLERHFCRMTDKTLWPFCDLALGVTTNCFDDEGEVLVEKDGPLLKRETHWESIEHWTRQGKWKRNLNGDGALVKN